MSVFEIFLWSISQHFALTLCKCSHTVLPPPLDTGRVEGDVLASLAPPVHLSGERLGLTLLVCMVSDFKRGHLEVSWRLPSEGQTSSTLYSIALNRKHRDHNAVAIITVATSDWPSYSCSVSHRRHPRVTRKHHTTTSRRTTAGQRLNVLIVISIHNLNYLIFLIKPLTLFSGDQDKVCYEDDEIKGNI